MTRAPIAVIGGDEREHFIATSLAIAGHPVKVFAGARVDAHAEYQRAHSLEAAVKDAVWLICPYPGLGPRDEIYAPASAVPIRLDRELLGTSRVRSGGVILGRASPALRHVCDDLGIAVHEAKADSALAVQTATAVSEALLPVLVESSDRLLREHLFVVLGFGSTGFAITQMLLGLKCEVIVAARSKRDRERARQLGARPVDFEDRVEVMEGADIVINTVPDPVSVPIETGASRTTAKFLDIASPPGGMDHQALLGMGLDVSWLRALGGLRAPTSMAEAELGFIESVIGADPEPTPATAGPDPTRSSSRERTTR